MRNQLDVEGIIEKNEKKLKQTKNGSNYCTFILKYPRKDHGSNHFRCHVFEEDLISMILNLDVGTKIAITGELSDYKSAANISRTVIIVKKIKRI